MPDVPAPSDPSTAPPAPRAPARSPLAAAPPAWVDPEPAGVTSPARPRPPLVRPPVEPARPPVTAEQRERGRMIGLAAIGVAAVVAVVMTIGIFLPAIGAITSGAVHPVEAAALPAQISVCDHDYGRRGGSPKSAADVRAADGADPVVVGSGGGCPAGVCEATGTCLDVVYLQTTDNRYAGYELLDESS